MTPREPILSITKKDFTIQTFRSGGKGGQHQNKTDSGVRIIHKESGAVAESRQSRSQHTNKRIAFRRLTETSVFKGWISWEIAKIAGVTARAEANVTKQMHPKNLKVETYDPSE